VNFPGRPARLDSTLVIVDDVWAMIGSSAFRRRGLTFDGGSDLVFTDTVLHNGVCSSIRDLRRKVMAARLGIPKTEASSISTMSVMPHPDYVRLGDGTEAFYVIRDLLAEQGTIEGLYTGEEPTAGLPNPDIVGIDQANPDGMEFSTNALDALKTALLSVFGSLGAESYW
jgi:hypothetical protein